MSDVVDELGAAPANFGQQVMYPGQVPKELLERINAINAANGLPPEEPVRFPGFSVTDEPLVFWATCVILGILSGLLASALR